MLCLFIRGLIAGRLTLAAENLALRQQLAVLQQSLARPRLRPRDRRFWVWLSRLWSNWRSVLVIVKPETVIRWHRWGFRYYWRWKSRKRGGRPTTAREVIDLIRRMAHENPTWAAPRIQSELYLLGHDVAESTVAKYLKRSPKPPSQNWRAFLNNHVGQIAAMDLFTVPTATFQILYCLVILCHERRRVVHFNVTQHPTAEWMS